MHHHAIADARHALVNGNADRGNQPAGLMSVDNRPQNLTKPERRDIASGAIGFEIAAAHARRFDRDDHIARAG
jgi:hypothetical protein